MKLKTNAEKIIEIAGAETLEIVRSAIESSDQIREAEARATTIQARNGVQKIRLGIMRSITDILSQLTEEQQKPVPPKVLADLIEKYLKDYTEKMKVNMSSFRPNSYTASPGLNIKYVLRDIANRLLEKIPTQSADFGAQNGGAGEGINKVGVSV